MRARQRHFNAKDAGANLVLDSRYIAQSDNTAVSAWADRSANAYTIEQTSGTSQPVFRTRVIGGNGVVRFDGSNDFLNGGDILDIQDKNLTLICVAKFSTTGGFGALIAKSRSAAGNGRYSLLRDTSSMIALLELGSVVENADVADTSTAWRIYTQGVDRTLENRLFFSGVSQASNAFSNSTSYTPTDVFLIGAYPNNTGTTPPNSAYYLNGDIGQVVVLLSSSYSTPIRKRLEHSAAYSFKIACS